MQTFSRVAAFVKAGFFHFRPPASFPPPSPWSTRPARVHDPRTNHQMDAVRIPDAETVAACARSRARCDEFNRVLADPMGSLQMYERTGRVCVAVQHCGEEDGDDVFVAQRAFLALSDRVKHARLRFALTARGVIGTEFTDDDEVEWAARLNPQRPPPPSTAAYEIIICKL